MSTDIDDAITMIEQLPDNWEIAIIRHWHAGSMRYSVSIDLVDANGSEIRHLGMDRNVSLARAITQAVLIAMERMAK